MPLIRTVSFTRAAKFEMLDAQDWYEAQKVGLGGRFRADLQEIVTRVAHNGGQFAVVRKQARRALLKRFPYAVIFTIDDDESITVVACIHTSRDPLRWQRRI